MLMFPLATATVDVNVANAMSSSGRRVTAPAFIADSGMRWSVEPGTGCIATPPGVQSGGPCAIAVSRRSSTRPNDATAISPTRSSAALALHSAAVERRAGVIDATAIAGL